MVDPNVYPQVVVLTTMELSPMAHLCGLAHRPWVGLMLHIRRCTHIEHKYRMVCYHHYELLVSCKQKQ